MLSFLQHQGFQVQQNISAGDEPPPFVEYLGGGARAPQPPPYSMDTLCCKIRTALV